MKERARSRYNSSSQASAGVLTSESPSQTPPPSHAHPKDRQINELICPGTVQSASARGACTPPASANNLWPKGRDGQRGVEEDRKDVRGGGKKKRKRRQLRGRPNRWLPAPRMPFMNLFIYYLFISVHVLGAALLRSGQASAPVWDGHHLRARGATSSCSCCSPDPRPSWGRKRGDLKGQLGGSGGAGEEISSAKNRSPF